MEENKNNYQKLKTLFSLPAILGIGLGIIAGYIYYIRIGCSSGTCPITSNPWMTMLWGGLIGYLLGDLFTKKKKKAE